MSSEESLAQSIAASVATLSQSVEELTDHQFRQIRRAKKLAIIAILGLILDTLLTGGGLFLLVRVESNASAIGELQNTLTQDGVCPLYRIILESYDPKGPVALADPARYNARFLDFEKSAKALSCPKSTKGPSG